MYYSKVFTIDSNDNSTTGHPSYENIWLGFRMFVKHIHHPSSPSRRRTFVFRVPFTPPKDEKVCNKRHI